MTTYVPVSNGVVKPGSYEFTAFDEVIEPGDLGQLIVFTGRPLDDVRFYGIKKVLLSSPPPAVTIEYPVVGYKDLKLWSPVTFIPSSEYAGMGRTALYFPEKSTLPSTQGFTVYRVFE